MSNVKNKCLYIGLLCMVFGIVLPSTVCAGEKKTFSKKADGRDEAIDEMVEKIPYSKTLKATWKVVNGDTDIYAEGLRVDRRNKGLNYQTDDMPFIGRIDGLKFQAEMGDESSMFFRYKIALPYE